MKNFNILLPILSTSNFKYLRHLKYFRHFSLSTLSILGTLLTLGTFLTCSNPASSEKRPQFIVDQNITTDTVWKKGTDVVIKGVVSIDSTATLTIEPDVQVTFEGEESVLEIYGSLIADGQNEKTQVSFMASEKQKTGGKQKCVTAFEGSALRLSFCAFDGFLIAVKSTQGRVILETSVFDNCSRGLYDVRADSCLVNRCVFSNNEFDVIFEQAGHSDTKKNQITNCDFINSASSGLRVTDHGYATVHNNQFTNNKQGISCEYSSVVQISNNSFLNCETSIRFYQTWEFGEVVRSEINNSTDGIYLDRACPLINYNNLLTCTGFKIISTQKYKSIVINARNNWWNTSIEDDIRRSIYDPNNNNGPQNANVIDYKPFLTQPVDAAGVF